jgi:hypothetical protein
MVHDSRWLSPGLVLGLAGWGTALLPLAATRGGLAYRDQHLNNARL